MVNLADNDTVDSDVNIGYFELIGNDDVNYRAKHWSNIIGRELIITYAINSAGVPLDCPTQNLSFSIAGIRGKSFEDALNDTFFRFNNAFKTLSDL